MERLDEDRAIVGFAQEAEARLMLWLEFAKGALLFLVVAGDNESGTLYIYARDRTSFYPLSLPIEQRYARFCEEEFDSLTKAFNFRQKIGNQTGPSSSGIRSRSAKRSRCRPRMGIGRGR